MYNLRTILLLLLLALLSSCQVDRVPAPPAACHYLNPDKELSTIGRIAFVELNNNSSYPQISIDTTEAIFQALQKKQLFSLAVVPQNAPAWRSLQLDVDSTYTLKQLSAIRKELKCDAVLIGTVTRYQPYPHMNIGLRLKLVDLTDGTLLWALEQIWDSADKTIEYRAKSFFAYQMRSGFEPLRERLVVISPRKFIRFVAYEIAETLQH